MYGVTKVDGAGVTMGHLLATLLPPYNHHSTHRLRVFASSKVFLFRDGAKYGCKDSCLDPNFYLFWDIWMGHLC